MLSTGGVHQEWGTPVITRHPTECIAVRAMIDGVRLPFSAMKNRRPSARPLSNRIGAKTPDLLLWLIERLMKRS
jgi:hypothetical protein